MMPMDKIKIDKSNSLPVSHQLKEAIIHKIRTGEYNQGSRIPTEVELIRLSGLSKATVSKVLAELERKKYVVRKRGVGTFISPKALSIISNKKIGILLRMGGKSNYLFQQAVQSSMQRMEERGYKAQLSLVENDDAELPNTVLEEGVSGLILIAIQSKKLIRSLLQRKLPFVCIYHQIREIKVNHVENDDFLGAKQAIDYLISLGHQRIGILLAPLDRIAFENRFRGYCESLEEHGIQHRKNWIAQCQEIASQEGFEKTKLLLEQCKDMTAIFAIRDHLAPGLYSAVREMGLRIPEDISVVGFDDQPFAEELYPGLTTVHQPFSEMGSKAVDKLLNIMRSREQEPTMDVISPYLAIRESCTKCRTLSKVSLRNRSLK